MENLRRKFEEQERANRELFENFSQKRVDSSLQAEFMTNSLIARMRFYHYKELLKVFAIHRSDTEFKSTLMSVKLFLVMPSCVALGFHFISPFSVLRSVGVWSTFVACMGSFYFNLKDELRQIAEDTEGGDVGFEIRYRFSQLAAYDKLTRSYKEEIE